MIYFPFCQETGLCGSTFWKAAQDQSRKFAKLDETGIVMISCRHRIAQKALNMFRGELFGYSYYLQKNYLANHGLSLLYTDVACTFSKWVQRTDPELYEKTKYAIGMMHVKGHPAHCEVNINLSVFYLYYQVRLENGYYILQAIQIYYC